MKRVFPVLTISLLLVLMVAPVNAANFQIAAMPWNAAQDGTGAYGSLTNQAVATGNCLYAPVGGQPVSLTSSFKVSGSFTGTFFAQIYASVNATFNPSFLSAPKDCTPTQTLAVSNSIDANKLTGAFQNFTFTFTPDAKTITNGQEIMVVVWATGTATGLGFEFEESKTGDIGQTYIQNTPACPNWSVNGCGGGSPNCNTGSNVCEDYFLLGTFPNTATGANPQTNPVIYPCNNFPACSQVTQTALQGSYIHAPDIPSDPFVWLFIIFALLTIGAYLVIRSNTQSKVNPRQYEIRR